MKILITGSSGHLGEALVRVLKTQDYEVVGVDIVPSPFTDLVGSLVDRNFVKNAIKGVNTVLHTATLHKPHVVTHAHQDFIDVNISATLNLLEESVSEGVESFIFTSTTSTFGDALTPAKNAPATWITEETIPIPKNIYGVTKTASEDLCRLFHRNFQLPCLILKTSRFFSEKDDNELMRSSYDDDNIKANELLFRRVDIEDVVNAHILAFQKAPLIGFGRYIISATTPFTPDDLKDLNINASKIVKAKFSDFAPIYTAQNWKMFPTISRVYVNELARIDLGWQPKYDFQYVLDCLKAGKTHFSPLSLTIGAKGYHTTTFEDGPYPV